MQYTDVGGRAALIVTDVGAAAGVSSIGTFQANTNGAGYSTGDVLIALSDGTWTNVTTGSTIAAPPAGDLDAFGSQADLEINTWQATATNGGIGYTTGDYLYEVFNTSSGGSSWYLNGGAIAAPPANERTLSGSSASSSGGGIAVTYDVVGGATGLQGAWDIANTQVYPADGSAAIAIGAGAGQATNLQLPTAAASSEIDASDTITEDQVFPVLSTLTGTLDIPVADGGAVSPTVTLDANTLITDYQAGDTIAIISVDGTISALFSVTSATGTTINANFQLNAGYSDSTGGTVTFPAGSFVVGQRRILGVFTPSANFKELRITVDASPAANSTAFVGGNESQSQAQLDDIVRFSRRNINPARSWGRKLGVGADDTIRTTAELTNARIMFMAYFEDIPAEVFLVQYVGA